MIVFSSGNDSKNSKWKILYKTNGRIKQDSQRAVDASNVLLEKATKYTILSNTGTLPIYNETRKQLDTFEAVAFPVGTNQS